MDGILYRISDNLIIGVIYHVISYTDTEVIGEHTSVKGIDLSQASFCIVESTELHEGDTLGEFTDVRNQLPKTPDQQKIDQLTLQSGDLLFRLAQAQIELNTNKSQTAMMLFQLATIQGGI